jgi:hypothetical protein
MTPKPKPKPSGNPLTRKVGPLPAYAWLGAIVVAYFVYTHYKGTAAAAAPLVDTGTPSMFSPPTTDSFGGGSSAGLPPSFTPTNTVAGGYGDPPSVSAAVASTSAAEAAPVEQGAPPQPTEQPGGFIDIYTPPYGTGFTGPNPSKTGFSPPDAVVGNATYGGQYSTPPTTIAPPPSWLLPPDAVVGNATYGGQYSTPYTVPTPSTDPTIEPSYLTPTPSVGHAVMV